MPVELQDYVVRLVNALYQCPKMKDADGRQQIINELPDHISSAIHTFTDPKGHVYAIVSCCTNFDGGIETLLERLEVFDGQTRAWPEVKHAAGALIAGLKASARVAPAVEPYVEGQRSLALVIGISRYKHGVDAGRDKSPEQFTNLVSAAADARAVHELLKARAGYDMAEPLLDEAATLSGILHGVDTLRKRCRHGYQTALIYFSGHGAVDDDERSFLVPHDARSNNLFATALWSKTLNAALEEFGDCKLVLLLDACHAGAVHVGGTKNARVAGFDPTALAGTASGDRFVIASCMPRQTSYEAQGNGIFTRQLIDLLNADDPTVFPNEEIDLFDLYRALWTKVKHKTAELFDGAVQEPFASFDDNTGVILAINEALRRKRLEMKRTYLRALLRFVPSVVRCSSPKKFERRLLDYVESRIKDEGFGSLYACFDEFAEQTQPDDTAAVLKDGRDLVKYFDEANTDSRSSSVPSNWGPTQERPLMVPRSGPVPAQDKLPASPTLEVQQIDVKANALLLGGPSPALSPATAERRQGSTEAITGTSEDRRVLMESDVNYILQYMMSNPKIYREARKLLDVLTTPGGVRSQDVTAWLVATPDEWESMATVIAERFAERFETAKKVEHTSAISLRSTRRV